MNTRTLRRRGCTIGTVASYLRYGRRLESNLFASRFLDARRKEQGIENPDMSDVMDNIQHKARDHARLPVQVRASPK